MTTTVARDGKPLRARVIAFYLPQFYPIPENDLWWGPGFTEWTNVAQARPLFPGHGQPHLPADLGFYDLRLPETRQEQADLARRYGVHGFCYYHYWFHGRRLLERPFDEVLASGSPDFPFCLAWINQDWTRTWNMSNRERLVAQRYSEEDDRRHIEWLLGVFQDPRYIRIGGKPLLGIYRAHSLPDAAATFRMWRDQARRRGVAEPYVVRFETSADDSDPARSGCDASAEFPPHNLHRLVSPLTGPLFPDGSTVFDYAEVAESMAARPKPGYRRYRCVAPSWDNTPRFPAGQGTMLVGSTPELYGRWLRRAVDEAAAYPPDERIVFVNAWNEWAEGAHLEPDRRHGHVYLEATAAALGLTGRSDSGQPDAGHDHATVPTDVTKAAATLERRYADLLGKYMALQREATEQLSAIEHSELVRALEHDHREARAWALRLRDGTAERDATIETLQAAVAEQTAWALRLRDGMAERDAAIERLQAAVAEQTAWALRSRDGMAERDATIGTLQARLEEQTAWALQSHDRMAERDAMIETLQVAVEEQTAWALRLREELTDRDATIRTLQAAVEEQTAWALRLREEVARERR